LSKPIMLPTAVVDEMERSSISSTSIRQVFVKSNIWVF